MELSHIAARSGPLSSFLRGEMAMSSGLMNKLKWGDGLQVNGVPCRTNHPVCPGDRITVDLREPRPDYPAQIRPLDILYEDDHLLALDKPAGMLIHPSRSALTGTLANYVLGYYDQTGQASVFHPMTRLDRDTYGIVLLAKNAHVHALLNALHTQGQIHKTYHALVLGGPETDQGIWDDPIARKPLPSLLREIRPDGKPARTEYRVLTRFDTHSLLALSPITGRTHQLRLHCAHHGIPILGDPQYASPESRRLSQTLGLTHQLLCARSLSLPHPITGTQLELSSHMEAELS